MINTQALSAKAKTPAGLSRTECDHLIAAVERLQKELIWCHGLIDEICMAAYRYRVSGAGASQEAEHASTVSQHAWQSPAMSPSMTKASEIQPHSAQPHIKTASPKKSRMSLSDRIRLMKGQPEGLQNGQGEVLSGQSNQMGALQGYEASNEASSNAETAQESQRAVQTPYTSEATTQAAPQTPARLVTIKDVMQATQLCRSTIYHMIERGELPKPTRLGKRRLFWPDYVIRDWCQKHGIPF